MNTYVSTCILTYMPTVSIYIKNEDFAKWLEIDNKSEFMHHALINDKGAIPSDSSDVQSKGSASMPVVRSLAEVMEAEEDEENEDPFPKTWMIDRATGHVVDTEAQDYVEGAGKAVHDWLKKHNRYVAWRSTFPISIP